MPELVTMSLSVASKHRLIIIVLAMLICLTMFTGVYECAKIEVPKGEDEGPHQVAQV